MSDIQKIDLAVWEFDGRAFSWIFDFTIGENFGFTWKQFGEEVCSRFDLEVSENEIVEVVEIEVDDEKFKATDFTLPTVPGYDVAGVVVTVESQVIYGDNAKKNDGVGDLAHVDPSKTKNHLIFNLENYLKSVTNWSEAPMQKDGIGVSHGNDLKCEMSCSNDSIVPSSISALHFLLNVEDAFQQRLTIGFSILVPVLRYAGTFKKHIAGEINILPETFTLLCSILVIIMKCSSSRGSLSFAVSVKDALRFAVPNVALKVERNSHVIILICMLGACSIQAGVDPCKQIPVYILRIRITIDEKGVSASIGMYSKCGFLLYAQRLFERASFKDTIVYNVMIFGFGHHGFDREANRLFEEMVGKGLKLDVVTYIALLLAYRHSGSVEAEIGKLEVLRIHNKNMKLYDDVVLKKIVKDYYNATATNADVEVILDLHTIIGRIFKACISLAIKDFYYKRNYSTMIAPHFRDATFGFVVAASAIVNLLQENGPYSGIVQVLQLCLDDESYNYAAVMLQSFRPLVKSIENVDPLKMRREEKLTFWSKIHNASVMHAYLAYGIKQHLKSTSIVKAAYNFGGHFIDVYDIQSSISGIRSHYSIPWLQTLLSPGKKLMAGNNKDMSLAMAALLEVVCRCLSDIQQKSMRVCILCTFYLLILEDEDHL